MNDTGSEIVGGYWRADEKNLVTFLTLAKSGHSALRNTLPVLKQAVNDLLTQKTLLCHSDNYLHCDTQK
jgi:hypothetical protein